MGSAAASEADGDKRITYQDLPKEVWARIFDFCGDGGEVEGRAAAFVAQPTMVALMLVSSVSIHISRHWTLCVRVT